MNNEILSFIYEPSERGNVCQITVGSDADGYLVEWHDFVANDWIERFDSLAVALARVAALVHCGSSDWAQGFATDAKAFAVVAEQFLDEVTV
jgi:hypothetical protein